MRLRAALPAGLAALVLAAPAQADTWTVTNGSSDATTACNPTAHTCVSLRAAIAASEATKEVADVINVPAGTININNDLVVQSDITINGTSARTNIIDGGFKYRGLRVTSTGSAKFNHFTIRNAAGGQGGVPDGGGVLNNSGIAQLSYVRVTTSAAGAGGTGGGIANLQGTLIASHVLVDNNTAASGAGISNLGGVETADRGALGVIDSTIFKNTAGTGGTGGIDSRGGTLNQVILGRVTMADNVGGVRGVGGLNLLSGTGQVVTSLFARNLSAGVSANCGDVKPTNSTNNVENDKECGFDLGSVDPGLATALTNAGGELEVLALAATSPAIDRQAGTCGTNITDQRGMSRPQGPGCDSGAYELDQAATMTITGGPSGTINTDSVQFDFSSNEPGVNPVCQLTGPGQSGGYVACYKSNAQPYSGLANGSYTFSVRDGAFPGSTPATRTFTVAALDTTIIDGPAGPTNDTTPTFTFSGVNGAVSFQCRVDSAAFAACTSPFTTAVLTPGPHTFEVRAQSAAGAPDPTPASRAFTIDTTAPETTITGGPAAGSVVASTSATFTYSSSEPGSSFQCQLDGAGFGACPAGYTGLAQGQHTFQVRATDPAGNTDTTPASRTWTVDTAAPETTITGGPAAGAVVASTSATFTYTSSEAGSTFQCQLDGAGFGACPAGYTGLGQGQHTFQVRAIDAVANVDSSPASRTWTVDTVAPDTTLTPITTPTNDSTPTFTLSSEAGATFQCRIDGAAYAACTSPFTTAVLTDGNHTLDVRALDAAGNTDATPASETFTVDTAAPNTTITVFADDPGNDNTPTFSFTSSEAGSAFQCRVDGAAFAACTSPFTTAALTDAGHTFDVRAIDPAGNTDLTPATQTFVVNTTTPNTTITDGPGPATNDTTPTFTFTGSGGATSFECRVDGAPAYTACTSPFTTAVLAVGSHTVDIRAINAAGTRDPSPASRTFTIDLTAPGAPVFTAPANNALLATSTVRLDGTAEAGATVDITEGATPRGSAVASGTGTWTVVLSAVADGTHVYTAIATDPAGNHSGSATRTVRVDTVAPDTTIASGPTGPTNTTTPVFTFTSNEAGTFECSVDGSLFAACSTPFTTQALGGGGHTIEVRAVDAAGNRDGTPASRSFTVDTSAPDTTLTPITTPSMDNTPTFAFASEAGATFQCRIDGAAYATCSSPFTTAPLADGSHTFDVRAVDAAGNPDPTPGTQTVVIDTTPPNTTLNAFSTPTSDTTPSFSFASNEGGASFECRVDGAAFAACTTPFTAAVLAEGPHTFDVRARDAAGNLDASPATRTFTVDTTAPDTTLTPVTTPSNDNTPTFSFTSSEAGTFQCRVDAAAFAACASPLTTGVLADGAHTFSVRAIDAAGNADATPETQAFAIDTGAPDTTIDSGPEGLTNDAAATFAFSADKASTFECRVDGGAFADCTSPFTTPALADGEHTVEVRATDLLGNRDATPASRAFTVDTTPPAAPDVLSGPDGPTTNNSPEFGFSATDATAVECRLDGPDGPGVFAACVSPTLFNALKPGDYVFLVRSTDAAGNARTTQRAFTVTVAQQATPTPTPTPTATPTPTPGPVDGVSVGAKPIKGTVLVKQPGAKTFVPLDPTVIKLGSEVDARNGTVEITRSDGGVAKFYDGIFKLSQSGGYTVLTLSEKLTGCPKAKKSSASAAAKKPKSRKLWGDGKGKFRTKGQFSAATVRGTIWLVQDTCTTTLTRVKQGVVEVQDLVKKKKVLVKAPKSYTARAKKK